MPFRAPLRYAASLRARLLLIFALVIGLALVPAVLMERAESRAVEALHQIVNTELRISELALSSVAVFGRARRHEKDFLLYAPEFGFKEARARYAVAVETSIAELKRNLVQIGELAADEATHQITAQTAQAAEQYLAGFKALVDLREVVALPNRGLAAQLKLATDQLVVTVPFSAAARTALLDAQQARHELTRGAAEAEHGRLMKRSPLLRAHAKS